ncbi:MAG: cytochrome c oxidase subunit II [Alphaproteobacteria bacterium]|nr:MAG: cytochrome c oxidase subunit II [Alphaproteobacteria bacterium]
MKRNGWIALCLAPLAVALVWMVGSGSAGAAVPEPWQLGFQPAGSPMKAMMNDMHNLLLVIITAISLFVLALLLYVIFRFSAAKNPNPSRTAHNTTIEIIWTVVPVLILIVIAIPSFRLLYFADKTREADLTVKVSGHQWYWSYEYPDHGEFKFDSYMVPTNELKPGQIRLLEVDNRIVLPVGQNVRILVTAADVMHSWFVPALGVQMYAIPGRTNETWVRIDKEGVYYGQCNQICGVNHGFMPIAVEAVSRERFAAWTEEAKRKFADAPAAAPAPTTAIAATPAASPETPGVAQATLEPGALTVATR